MVDLVPPSRWSAEPWRYERMLGEDTSSQMDGWAVHWPGSVVSTFADPTFAETVARLLSWERFHTDPPPDGKGWRGLAYDYAIDMAGRGFRIRGTGQSGATSGDYDEDGVPNNRETDAVLLVLGAADVPSPKMLATFAALVEQLGGPRDYIIGHRQAKGTSTTCPGNHAMRHVVQPAQDWPTFATAHTGDDMPTARELLDTDINVAGRDVPLRDVLAATRLDAYRARVDAEVNQEIVRRVAREVGLSDAEIDRLRDAVIDALADGVNINVDITTS